MAPVYAARLEKFHPSGQVDNLGAGETTVLDLEDTEGPMRLAPFVGG
jgi:hypothetical protein